MSEDGTQFVRGMISGGTHANIFKLSLGTSQLDNKIVKLVDEVQQLEL